MSEGQRAVRPTIGSAGTAAVRRPRVAFAVLGSTQVTLIMGISLAVVGLPALQREMGLSQRDIALVTSAYGLAFAGLLLFGGRLADVLGHRRVFLVGVQVFGIASVAASVAPWLVVLLAARFGQGIGAALAGPSALALLTSVYADPAERTRAFAVWGGLGVFGATLGILASGVLSGIASWRAVYLLPALIALGVAVLSRRVLPPGPVPARGGMDAPGAILATGGLTLVSFGLFQAGETSFLAAGSAVPFGFGVLLLAGFVVAQRRGVAPLVPRGVLASPGRVIALLVLLATAAGTSTMYFVLSLYFQQVQHHSALWTGAAFLPCGIVQITASRVAGHVVARFGARAVTAAGLIAGAAGLCLLAAIAPDSPYAGLLLVSLIVLPSGATLAFSGAMVAAVRGVRASQGGVAGGVANTAIELGPTLGLAVLLNVAGRAVGAHDATATAGYAVGFVVNAVALIVVAALVLLAFGPDNAVETQ